MNDRWLAVMCTLIAIVLLVPLPTAAQGSTAAADGSTVPRTSWGAPDLRGVWDFRTITPLERPSELAGKDVLTAEEAAEFEQETLSARDKDLRVSDGISTERDVANAYNQFWWDYGDKLTEDRRTSLIVDPPDGRIPYTAEVRERRSARTGAFRGRIPAGPEDRGLAERWLENAVFEDASPLDRRIEAWPSAASWVSTRDRPCCRARTTTIFSCSRPPTLW